MSIRKEYFKYLDHFGHTIALRDMLNLPDDASAVALRHDVDHNLDFALETAFWENEKGCRATYFLLNTAPYWDDPLLVEKCLQIQEFGHEIGIHINLLTEWMSGQVDDVEAHFIDIMKPLRDAGVLIKGISAHGDKLCYEHNFINYWCFSELRPENPHQTESGLSAEGIPVSDVKYQIRYPENDEIKRSDGKTLDLWTLSMKKLGLEYDASHVAVDKYYTDSGGGWTRSEDPLNVDVSDGRHQILMHPLYWIGPQKVYFFLSIARSGSKWLANYLEKATSVTARHEFTLNHTFVSSRLKAKKRTSRGFAKWINNRHEVEDMIRQSGAWISSLNGDYAEANVYLPHALPILTTVFPDACLVHLKRNPKDVVRSIINRDWYDTPDDDNHPVINIESWAHMSQFQKACWYVESTTREISEFTKNTIVFERMVKDVDYLTKVLKEMGIITYPLLSRRVHKEIINSNCNNLFPAYEEWSCEQKEMLESIVGMGAEVNSVVSRVSSPWSRLKKMFQREVRRATVSRLDCDVSFDQEECQNMTFSNCTMNLVSGGILVYPKKKLNAYVAFFGGKWRRLSKRAGLESSLAFYYRGTVCADVKSAGTVRLFALLYGERGNIIYRRTLGNFQTGDNMLSFSFRPRPDVYRFDLAVHIVSSGEPPAIELKSLRIESVDLASAGR